MRAYVMEFIGTFFLVFAVGLTGNPVAIGLMLGIMIYAGGHVSGGHYNPAVSLAVWLRGKLPVRDVAPYWIVQITGGFIAAAIVFYLSGKTFGPAPGADVGAAQAIVAELICTFALATVVLNMATAKKTEGNYAYGFAIGLTVTASAFAVGGISGGAFNPAVAIGSLVWAATQGGDLSALYIYLIGPLAGGALAAVVFKFLNQE